MEKYNISGMSCASCVARVEKAVKSVEGVTSCAVNLLTNSMTVEGSASSEKIINAVEKAGYGAKKKGVENEVKSLNHAEMLKDKETPVLLKRLIPSLVVLLILMYFSMGYMMWNFPVPKWIDNHISIGIIQMILASIILLINKDFFINGIKGLLHRSPNMGTLVTLGSGISYFYSLFILFSMIYKITNNAEHSMQNMEQLYFESSAMVVTLITLGKTLEARSKGKTTNALKGLMELAPKTATILKDGKEIEVGIDEVKLGDNFVVRAGERIPVDGVIIQGNGSIDESCLTGESIPVDKSIADTVSAGTISKSGYFAARATRVGEDTTLSQIIKMVSDSSATKAPIAKIADKVSGIFVPFVLGIALITFVIWMIIGETVGFSLSRAITVLVISCPCALGLATPVAIMVGNGKGAKNGILFKTAESLEQAGKVQIIALDKTGTITKGEPSVTDIIPIGCESESALLKYAYSLELKSEHPLAKAITEKGKNENSEIFELNDFETLAGNGLSAKLDGKTLLGGSLSFIGKSVEISEEQKVNILELAEKGKTPLLFAYDNILLGIIAVADTIKEDSPKAIKELQNMGIKVVMLTGDNEYTANAIGKEVGVDQIIAGVLPDEKEAVIKELKKEGRVAMVGDGINDAPALMSTDVGIAIGCGSDIAVDSAEIVLINNKLSDVCGAIRLSRRTVTNICENLFWAFIYNLIGISLASGMFIKVFGWELTPMYGAAAMSLSSVCVVLNALRLNLVNIHNAKHDRKIKHKKVKEKKECCKEQSNKKQKTKLKLKEKKKMKKTIKIEGMMCGHCSSTVKKALLKIDGVDDAEVSHETGLAVVTLNAPVLNDALRIAIENVDYKVLEIK